MLDFLKKVLAPTHPLGALPDDPDYRDIKYNDVVGSSPTVPKQYSIDISHIPLSFQYSQPSCVAHAEGMVIANFDLKEKKNTDLSHRWLYGKCKKLDSYIGEGTYPRIASSILKDIGIPSTATFDDDHSLSYNDFIDISENEYLLRDASLQKVAGYVTIIKSPIAIKQALIHNDLVTASLPVDWSAGWYFGPNIKAPNINKITGSHRITIFGYKDEGEDTRFFFRNWWGSLSKKWGDGGIGSFLFSDYDIFLLDLKTYIDLPQNVLDIAKNKPYIFTQTLRFGSRGNEVKELQKKLNISPSDGIFGKGTHAVVITFQKEHGLYPDGIVGEKSRKILNGDEKKSISPTVDKLADAIQEHEGYFPGSRSYRNNNPFNLRFNNQSTAIGKDKDNFCIFASYSAGRRAGISQIKIVMEERSSYYPKDCTLLKFFQIYAPDSDGNNSNRYASFVAQKLRIGVDYLLKDFILSEEYE